MAVSKFIKRAIVRLWGEQPVDIDPEVASSLSTFTESTKKLNAAAIRIQEEVSNTEKILKQGMK